MPDLCVVDDNGNHKPHPRCDWRFGACEEHPPQPSLDASLEAALEAVENAAVVGVLEHYHEHYHESVCLARSALRDVADPPGSSATAVAAAAAAATVSQLFR